jgi:NADPH:quinone reductase-like Zn-dependent oxidoreductase
MRAWQAIGHGEPADVLRLRDLEPPAPGPGEVRIRVAAAALNPIDAKLLHGDLRRIMPLAFPRTIGFDAAGVVDAAGGDAGFVPGERVFVRASRDTLGAFADCSVQPARFVARAPRGVDARGAASLPLVGLTTVQGLVDRARAQPGQRILIHGGSGGLGSFAVQYAARVLGLRVDTTTSARNADWVAGLGAERVVAYDRDDVRTGGARYDVVFDTLGGRHTLEAFDLVLPGGCVVSVAGPPDAQMRARFGANPLLRAGMWWQARAVHAAAARKGARYFRFLTESDGAQLAGIAECVDAGAVHPVIDAVFAFEDLPAAFERLATGRARGKIVLDLEAPLPAD